MEDEYKQVYVWQGTYLDGETYIKVINKDKGVIEQVNGRIDGVCKLTVQPNSFVKSFGDYKHLSVEDYDRAKVISCLNNKPCKALGMRDFEDVRRE